MSITRRAKGSSVTIVTDNEAELYVDGDESAQKDNPAGITPVEFSVNDEKEVALCLRKQSKTPPFCDATQ